MGLSGDCSVLKGDVGTGLSSADPGLWGFQLCPGTTRNCSAELQGMSIWLLLRLEEREGSLWSYFSPFVGQTVYGTVV